MDHWARARAQPRKVLAGAMPCAFRGWVQAQSPMTWVQCHVLWPCPMSYGLVLRPVALSYVPWPALVAPVLCPMALPCVPWPCLVLWPCPVSLLAPWSVVLPLLLSPELACMHACMHLSLLSKWCSSLLGVFVSILSGTSVAPDRDTQTDQCANESVVPRPVCLALSAGIAFGVTAFAIQIVT